MKKPKPNSEKKVQNNIIKKLGGRTDCRVFRNSRGVAFVGVVANEFTRDGIKYILLKNPRRNTFGLFKGASDLIGWTKVKITPEMVGDTVAVFTSIEVKAENNTKKTNEDQSNWIKNVKISGGKAGFAHSVEEAELIVDKV